jgi:hypothetical protein
VYQWLSDKTRSPRDQDAPNPHLVLQPLEPLLQVVTFTHSRPVHIGQNLSPELVRTHAHSCMNLPSTAIQQNPGDDRGWACLKSARNLRTTQKS